MPNYYRPAGRKRLIFFQADLTALLAPAFDWRWAP
jgi:hypothetical protein